MSEETTTQDPTKSPAVSEQYQTVDHHLGPKAIRVENDDFFQAWYNVGELVHFAQPSEKASDGLIVMTRDAAETLARGLLARLAPAPEKGVREALEPFTREVDRIERDYGFDRPDWQLQCLMIPMSALKKLRAALATQPAAGSEEKTQ